MTDRFSFFLDWDLNCQFAGLLWAREKGIFADFDLEVDLVSPSQSPDLPVLDLVLGGGVCAGCMEDNLIVRAAVAGHGIKAIGATMQASPIQLMSLPEAGIVTLNDLVGRNIAVHSDGIYLLKTVLALHGLDTSAVNITVGNWNLSQLKDGTFDAVQGYTTTEPHALARLGYRCQLTPITHHDLHPWAQMMFTSDQVIDQHPDVLGRFVSACKLGWRSAMSNLPEAAAMVATHSQEHNSVDENLGILGSMLPLIEGESGLDACVTTDPNRWRRNLATYARTGMIDHEPAYAEIVCDRFM
jgi:ABC-type nitrate/sulfonate/bicarbonate transport system substrate-binding protein